MIRYVSGDLLVGDMPVIAHGVAPNDPFNQGLAHALRELYPAMYKDFRHHCQTAHPKAGEIWSWGGAEGRRIVALFTQDGVWGHGEKPGKASTQHVNHALKAFAAECRKEGWRKIGLPRLATGVGGLDWAEVRPLIEKHLADLDADIEVVETYHPQQAVA